MNEFDKKFLDLYYIDMRDKIIKYLFDNDRVYSLSDSRKIKKILKYLLKLLERGN